MRRLRHTDELDHLIHLRCNLGTWDAANTGVETHQLTTGEVAIKVRRFWQETDTATRGHRVTGLAINLTFSRGGFQKTENHFDRGALPRAIRSE